MAPFHPPLGALLGSLGCTWASLGTLWDAVWSFRADLAQPECHSTPLGGPLPPIQLPHRLSGARRQLCWAPPALSWGAVGANLVWTSGFAQKKYIPGKSSAPGSESARDKLLVQKIFFEKKIFPRQRSCPGQVACSKEKVIF